jgi:hypothetical protein
VAPGGTTTLRIVCEATQKLLRACCWFKSYLGIAAMVPRLTQVLFLVALLTCVWTRRLRSEMDLGRCESGASARRERGIAFDPFRPWCALLALAKIPDGSTVENWNRIVTKSHRCSRTVPQSPRDGVGRGMSPILRWTGGTVPDPVFAPGERHRLTSASIIAATLNIPDCRMSGRRRAWRVRGARFAWPWTRQILQLQHA